MTGVVVRSPGTKCQVGQASQQARVGQCFEYDRDVQIGVRRAVAAGAAAEQAHGLRGRRDPAQAVDEAAQHVLLAGRQQRRIAKAKRTQPRVVVPDGCRAHALRAKARAVQAHSLGSWHWCTGAGAATAAGRRRGWLL